MKRMILSVAVLGLLSCGSVQAQCQNGQCAARSRVKTATVNTVRTTTATAQKSVATVKARHGLFSRLRCR